MEENNQNLPPTNLKKKILVILSLFVATLLLVAATIFVLTKVLGDGSTAKTVSNDKIISTYKASKSTIGLSDKLYKKQSSGLTGIYYKLDNKTYATRVNTKYSASFIANSKDQADDNSKIESQTTKFMKKYDFAKTNNSIADTASLKYTTYTDKNAVCQLQNSVPANNSDMLRFHILSCASIKSFIQEYATIDKLLAIYQKTHKAPQFTEATRIFRTNKTVSYATINLNTKNNRKLLLFAAIKNDWEYLADLYGGDAKYATGKYIITPEIRATINNPKYNGVLAREIY